MKDVRAGLARRISPAGEPGGGERVPCIQPVWLGAWVQTAVATCVWLQAIEACPLSTHHRRV